MNLSDKRKNSRNLKKLRKNLKFIIVVVTLFVAVLYSVIKLLKPDPTIKVIGVLVVLIPVCQVIIFLFEEGFFIDIMFKYIGRIHKDPFVGKWNIKIVYLNENNQEVLRTGSCSIEDTIAGLRIDGNEILGENNKIEVFDWHTNSLEILEYSDETKLIYTYFTYDVRASLSPAKIGLVMLSRQNIDEPFEGTFRDFEVSDGRKVREGTVVLYR